MTTLYDILGITSSASESDIKKAYRKLAKEYHPDRIDASDPKKDEYAEKFKQVSEAFEILSNAEEKKMYDELGDKKYKERKSGQSDIPNGMNPHDLFKMFSGMMHQQSEVPDVVNHIELTLEQMYCGYQTKMIVERASFCKICEGTGTKSKQSADCGQCGGQGTMMVQIGPGMITQARCPVCKGKGIDTNIEKCSECKGKKFSMEKCSIRVTVPAGVHHKYPIIIENEGNEIPLEEQQGSKKRSNIVFVCVEKPHNVFKRIASNKGSNTDIMIELDIKFYESINGFSRTINHLDGKPLVIQHTGYSRHNDMLIAKQKGMPNIKNKSFGNLYVKLNVEHPKMLKISISHRSKICKLITEKTILPISKAEDAVELIYTDSDSNAQTDTSESDDEQRGGRDFSQPQCKQM